MPEAASPFAIWLAQAFNDAYVSLVSPQTMASAAGRPRACCSMTDARFSKEDCLAVQVCQTTTDGGQTPSGRQAECMDPATSPDVVLIVEDEPSVRSFCSVVLRRSGYRVVEAGDPAAALNVLAEMKEPVDLVLTDMTMPGMNGKEMVQRIQQPDLKVLYMSGYSQNFEPGLNLLEKPFTSADLLKRVRDTLSM